jgi:anthranilate phosphoribosyltransferase
LDKKIKDFGNTIMRLIRKENLSKLETFEAFRQILVDEQPEIQQGAFLAALNAKGETAQEIAGSWEAIYMLDTVKITPDSQLPVVDNCGTGMDTLKTFNISTAAAVVAATCGVVMAKHGARAITSSCGTIDVLEAIGLDVECDPIIVKNSIEEAGIGIFNGMSPKVHPKALGRILSQIAFGTTLNISASLANPALPRFAVRGVYSKEMVKPTAVVMKEIGYKRAIVMHGLDKDGKLGMDEASILGETVIAELKETGAIEQYSIFPEEFDIGHQEYQEIFPYKTVKEEASRLVGILKGITNGPCLDIVCLNASLLLYLMDIAPNILKGYKMAKEIIKSGSAIEKLREWVRVQQSYKGSGISIFENIYNERN